MGGSAPQGSFKPCEVARRGGESGQRGIYRGLNTDAKMRGHERALDGPGLPRSAAGNRRATCQERAREWARPDWNEIPVVSRFPASDPQLPEHHPIYRNGLLG